MPSDTAASLLSAARGHGAGLSQDCAVTGLIVQSGKVLGVTTSRGDFRAPVVVNAAGPWAGQVNRMAGLDLLFETWRHDTMFVRRPPDFGPGHPTVIDAANEMYFRPEGDLTLVGLEDGNPLGESPDGDTDHARPGFVERSIDRLAEPFERTDCCGVGSGLRGCPGDEQPVARRDCGKKSPSS